MNKMNQFTMVLSKIMEVVLWVGLAFTILGLVFSIIGVNWLNRNIRENKIDVPALIREANEKVAEEDEELAGLINEDNYNLLVRYLRTEDFLREDGTVRPSYICLFIVEAIFHCLAFAMVFRNIYLILKTAKGKAWFGEGETPFQPEITRMIREIGIFLLALAVIQFILSFFSSTSVHLVYILLGLLMLSLSSFFQYGESLQRDTDGLI